MTSRARLPRFLERLVAALTVVGIVLAAAAVAVVVWVLRGFREEMTARGADPQSLGPLLGSHLLVLGALMALAAVLLVAGTRLVRRTRREAP